MADAVPAANAIANTATVASTASLTLFFMMK